MSSENNEIKTDATIESFWSILGENGLGADIYIPRMQRDYAQGRTDDVTTQIRDKFIQDIFDVLVDESGRTLNLNFIYGNVDDKDGTKKFIPIDGQQRLTTLFLIHWYFAVYSGKIDSDPDVKKRLLRFQYETRNVTGKFCNNLTEKVRIDLKNFPNDKKLSEAIRNYYWFFSDFENDASISSMLVMLNDIHAKGREYPSETLDKVFDKLTSDNPPIRFLFLNLKDAGLTDSIYIKMNARGKALTHFENFKAQLRSFLASDEQFADKFIENVNGRWSQFFWTPEYRRLLKDKDTKEGTRETNFDEHIMKFFRFYMFMDYIVGVNGETVKNRQKDIRDTLLALQKEPDYLFTARLFNDAFKNVYAIQSDQEVLGLETFMRLYKLLNILSKRQEDKKDIRFTDHAEYQKDYLDETNNFLRLIGTSEERGLSYEEQVVLFAEYDFLIKYSESDDSFYKEKELTRWIRLVYNLVKPTLNLQLDIFFSMIRSVHALVENGAALDCDHYMSTLLRRNYRQSPLSIFYENQVVEESEKSILMQLDPVWKQAIVESENTFMDGQTGSLFDFTGLTQKYETEIKAFEDNNPDATELKTEANVLSDADHYSAYYRTFMNYLKNFEMVFDKDGVKKELEDKALFRRALLTYGGDNSYILPPNKSNQSFLDNLDRNYGFKRLLRDSNQGKREMLKLLLDDLNTSQDIKAQLENIISKANFDKEGRWKKYFVEMPELLDSLAYNEDKKDPDGKWVFYNQQRFIRWNSNDDILLLSRTQTNSFNRELYSYVFFLKARKENLNVNYHPDYTDLAEKYAYYIDKVGTENHVTYKKRNDGIYAFVVSIPGQDEVVYYNDLSGILDYTRKTIKKI